MSAFNVPAGIHPLTATVSEWLIGSGIPVALHGYSIDGNDVGDGLSLYHGNEAVEDPVILDQAIGSANTTGRTVMFNEPIVFPNGLYIQPDAAVVGAIFYHKI